MEYYNMSTRNWSPIMDELLVRIKKAFNTTLDVHFMHDGEVMAPDDWVAAGCPLCIQLKESKMVNGHYYRVFFDTAYGYVILVKGADEVCTVDYGTKYAFLGNVCAIHPDISKSSKWIWEQ